MKKNYVAVLPTMNRLIKIKTQWLQYRCKKINENSYGAGLIYELYEVRKQDAINAFLHYYRELFTPQDIEFIKQETEYIENFEPYYEIDPITGEVITLPTIVNRIMGTEMDMET